MRDAIAVSCFFLSGVAGLIYEVCWIRRAGLVFGSTVQAVSTVLAVFFLGLALGSHVFGRLGQRSSRPLRLYALLELALAVLAAATIPAFDGAGAAYGALLGVLPESPALGLAARLVLVTAILLPPAVLMGGTLPLFCRQYVLERARITSSVGFLYGVNTYGAVCGCLLAGFALLPGIGVRASILLGALLNLVAGAATASLRLPGPPPAPPPVAAPDRAASRRAWRLGALVFLSGFTLLGHEVVWTRFLRLLVRNTVHTYTLTLSVVLLGIAVGSLLAPRLLRLPGSHARVFGALQVLIGLAVTATLHLPPGLWRRLGDDSWIYVAVLLLPAVLSGASFPIAVRLWVDDPSRAGVGVGRVAAINTVGGILGSLAFGFAGVPGLGLEASVGILTALNLATGLGAWWLVDRSAGGRPGRAAAWAAVGAWLAIPLLAGTRLPRDFLGDPERLVDWREGRESNLGVLRGEMGLTLTIDLLPQGSDVKSPQAIAAHVPMLIHPEPKSVLVVGVGAGQTPARFLLYDVERLDCVDVEGAVFDLVARHFPSGWMRDPRVSLIAEDGRSAIAYGDRRWDVISLELGQTFRPGIASFYTEDFYRLARARLAPGGILSQFVPIQLTSREVFQDLVATFVAVFPESLLWYNSTELLLLGASPGPIAIDPGRLRARLAEPRIREDLDFAYWGDERRALHRPEVFLAGFLSGPRELAALSAGVPPLRDDRPILEYRASVPGEFLDRVTGIAELLGGHLGPVASAVAGGLDPETASQIEAIRARNLGDLRATALLVYVPGALAAGDRAQARALAESALRANPESARALALVRSLGGTPAQPEASPGAAP